MRTYLRPKYLPLLVLATGTLGFLLRLVILGGGPDQDGLYQRAPFAWALLWLMMGLTAAAVWIIVQPLQRTGSYRQNFPPSPSACVGGALAALGLIARSFSAFSKGGVLGVLTGLSGLAAAAVMALVALARLQGRRPFFASHALVCLHMALGLFNDCRDWSNESQFGMFLMELLAQTAVMLAAYYLATFDVALGRRRPSLFWSLMGVELCLIALADRTEPLFYMTMAVWLTTNLCSLRPLRRRPRPQEPQEPQGPEPPTEDL